MSVPYGSDPWLDARLRNVPLPPGMLARLNQVIDEAAAVEAPEDLLEAEKPKLYHPNRPIPIGPGFTDAQMDSVLLDVQLPAGFLQRLEKIAYEPRRSVPVVRYAAAAAVILAVGIGYLARSQFMPIQGNGEEGISIAVADPKIGAEIPQPISDPNSPDVAIASSEPPVAEIETEPSIEDLRFQLMHEATWPVESSNAVANNLAEDAPAVTSPNKESIFASGRIADTVPELERAAIAEPPRGIVPPTTPGYDLRFRAKYGLNPFVIPAGHASLQSLRVPLITNSSGYQRAWQRLADQKLPAAHDVHIEEFLAAVDYDFAPAPVGSLALRSAAGPSPFGAAGARLLQVGVQAGALPPQKRAATAMTIVVETSGGMRRGGRLMMVRRALADMVAQLSNEDQFSLIASGSEPRLLVNATGRRRLGRILSAIQSLAPEQSSNIGASLEMAVNSAKDATAKAGIARRVVLITDGLSDSNDSTVRLVEGLMKGASAKGIVLQIVDIGESSTPREAELLDRIAKSGNGKVFQAIDADAAQFALLETLTGRDQTVARQASLQINFNPQSVAAYRLLGHETETLTGSQAAALAIDLRADETATALLELRLNPQGGDEVATIELNWQDAATGEKRSARQRISRLQFAKSFAEAPLSLQSAAIVGHAAEILRGSYFAAGSKSLEPVLELAAQASPLVTDRPSMRAFQSFVEQAEKVRLRGTKR